MQSWACTNNMSKPRKPRGKFSKLLFPDSDIKKDFKDNREKFRLLNKFQKEPPTVAFMLATMVAVCFIIMMLAMIKNATFKTNSIIMLSVGMFASIGFEQAANYHYKWYSTVANSRRYDSIIFNIRLNYTLRTIAMFSLLLVVLSVTAIVFTKSGDISKLW